VAPVRGVIMAGVVMQYSRPAKHGGGHRQGGPGQADRGDRQHVAQRGAGPAAAPMYIVAKAGVNRLR